MRVLPVLYMEAEKIALKSKFPFGALHSSFFAMLHNKRNIISF